MNFVVVSRNEIRSSQKRSRKQVFVVKMRTTFDPKFNWKINSAKKENKMHVSQNLTTPCDGILTNPEAKGVPVFTQKRHIDVVKSALGDGNDAAGESNPRKARCENEDSTNESDEVVVHRVHVVDLPAEQELYNHEGKVKGPNGEDAVVIPGHKKASCFVNEVPEDEPILEKVEGENRVEISGRNHVSTRKENLRGSRENVHEQTNVVL